MKRFGRVLRGLVGGRPSVSACDRVTIVVDNGYHPDIVQVPAGTPVQLRFDRRENNPCSESVVFASLGRSAQLPEGRTVSLDLPPLAAGTYGFACPNGLLRGELIVSLTIMDGREHATCGRRRSCT
jgi:plastocyanin domain-containing protein